MKTITISDEQFDFINGVAKEMEKQSNRATQFPLFVIQVDVKRYGDSSWCNEAERKDDSDGEMCDSCEKLYDDSEEIPEYCSDCDSDCFVWFNWDTEFDLNAGVFFTAEACEKHIKQNDYHYTNPKSYAIGAWRNPEMEQFLGLIFTMASLSTPSCYK